MTVVSGVFLPATWIFFGRPVSQTRFLCTEHRHNQIRVQGIIAMDQI